MDNKPLIQDRPPAYNTVPGAYNYQQPQAGYGAIPQPAPAPAAFPAPPPPYTFPSAQGHPAAPAQAAATGTPANYPSTYTIIQPSVVVVGGCPACRFSPESLFLLCIGGKTR
ncbi:brain protein I3 isoform X2 [Tachysurus fulvidraco]|uniref:brain protein I3 isoform X2 n=1 Tax=Tachysurus fulvidraco TaxID=1234273 RepID=UPI001FEE3D4E|nr:brain protein I3 isoform X2 [Tachysurus fulvidraco]